MIRTFQLAHGYLIGHAFFAFRLTDLFRVLPALNTAPDLDPGSNTKPGSVSCIASPGNAWDIVGLAVWAVHRQQNIRNFSSKRCLPINRRLADVSIQEDLVGLGIGTSLHEDPQIPNFAQKRRGIRLVPGMTLAIEPMITMGRPEVCWLDDDWTVVTEDESLAAHYENTILITEGEPEIPTFTK